MLADGAAAMAAPGGGARGIWGGASRPGQLPATFPIYQDPASSWLVAEDPTTGVRYICIAAPDTLTAAAGRIAATGELRVPAEIPSTAV